jgi:hypothetical protein
VRDPDSLVRTLAIQPEYLKTHGKDGIINYSEWTVPLGRRFRSLKLWFLIRAYGLEGLRGMIRNHVAWVGKLAKRIVGKVLPDKLEHLFKHTISYFLPNPNRNKYHILYRFSPCKTKVLIKVFS